MLAILLVAGPGITASGQIESAVRSTAIFNLIPGMFRQHFIALGNRVQGGGKELTTYSGQLFDKKSKSSAARVLHQLPGLIRLEGFKVGGAALSFDGEVENGINSNKSDEALIETFVMDLPEGMFASVQQGAAVRLIGRGFGPDPRLVPDYKGPRYDIYEVTGSVRCRQDQLVRSKLYYFDSATRLLQSTRYYDRSVKPPVKIETRFSNWGNIEGSAYPARVDHYEGGTLMFSFIAESIEGGASIDKASFE